jgi:hypothetical protein
MPRVTCGSTNSWRFPGRTRIRGTRWISATLLAAYLLVFYPPVIRREERELKSLYGAAFEEYARQVPAFCPRLTAAATTGQKFSWSLYRRNREYEAAMGLVVAMAVLWILTFWPR